MQRNMKQKNDAHEGTRSGVADSLTVPSDLAEPALGWSSLLAAGKGKFFDGDTTCMRTRHTSHVEKLTLYRLFVMSEQDFEWLLNVLDEIQGNYLRELSNKLATLFEDTGAANSISILDASREADFLACPKGTRKLLSMLFS